MSVDEGSGRAYTFGGRAVVMPRMRRLAIILAGCAVMAMSGGQLARYLDASSGLSAAAQPSDAPPLS